MMRVAAILAEPNTSYRGKSGAIARHLPPATKPSKFSNYMPNWTVVKVDSKHTKQIKALLKGSIKYDEIVKAAKAIEKRDMASSKGELVDVAIVDFENGIVIQELREPMSQLDLTTLMIEDMGEA